MVSTTTRSVSSRALAGVLLALLCATSAIAKTAVSTPKGAIIDARLSTRLNSKTSHAGDPFTLAVTNSLFHRHPELQGAVIAGHVEDVTPASATQKATMQILFDSLTFPDGHTEPLRVRVARMSQLEPKTHTVRDIGIIVAGAVTGHMVSKKTGHGGGTFAGAAAGFALASSLKSDINLPKGTIIQLKLLQALSTPTPS